MEQTPLSISSSVAILLSVVALFLAWRANIIAQQAIRFEQSKPHLKNLGELYNPWLPSLLKWRDKETWVIWELNICISSLPLWNGRWIYWFASDSSTNILNSSSTKSFKTKQSAIDDAELYFEIREYL